jgi:hypothetical protein
MTTEDLITYHHNSEVVCKDDYLNYSAFFEDNGRVAYAYLLRNQEIISDVWLYNHGPSPLEPEWHSPEKLPFANPVDFASNQEVTPVENPNQVSFQWNYTNEQKVISVEIYLEGILYGILKPGFKPGFAKLAIKDSPVAKVMNLMRKEV